MKKCDWCDCFINFSGEIVDLKIMQSDLLRAFWIISQEQDLFQRMDLCRNTADNINFYYETNSVNIDDHFFSMN